MIAKYKQFVNVTYNLISISENEECLSDHRCETTNIAVKYKILWIVYLL